MLPDSTLVTRRLGRAAARLYAAPAYLRRHGTPSTPADLSAHVLYDNAPAPGAQAWQLTREDGETQVVPGHFRVVGNDPVLLRELAAAGGGIANLPAFVAAPAVQGRRLVPVLPGWVTRQVEVQILFPSHKSLSPALRAFVDLAADRLGPALQQA